MKEDAADVPVLEYGCTLVVVRAGWCESCEIF